MSDESTVKKSFRSWFKSYKTHRSGLLDVLTTGDQLNLNYQGYTVVLEKSKKGSWRIIGFSK